MSKFVTLFFSFLSILSYAQFGPGGIGDVSTNGLWLKANALSGTDGTNVPNWTDQSGNSNDALQIDPIEQPQFYNSSALNGMPIVRFDGINDQMAVPDDNILDNSAGITFYAVLRPRNLTGAPRGILGKRITFTISVEYAYTWFFWSGNRLNNDIHTSNNRYNTGGITFANNQNYLLAKDFNGALPSTERSRIMSAGATIRIAPEASSVLPNSNQDLALGALNVDYGTYLGADYAEVIHYNYSLDSLEHIIVSNYLSAKYDIALAANDFYDEDDAANGNFDFEVAGIGRINASTEHLDSKGEGIVRISDATDLNDNEFLFWGHDGGIQEATNFADVPADVEARFDRVWRVSETNQLGTSVDVGALKIAWDLNGLGTIVTSDLRLLVDTDNDGVFSDEAPIGGAVDEGGGVYSFSGVTAIEDNLRFTLATINLSRTPLPVELKEFNVVLNDQNEVDINWITLSELNSDYFSVERSRDGQSWQEIIQLKAAGQSSVKINYTTKDQSPLPYHSYYRLKQVDFDGTFDYSSVKSVYLSPNQTKHLTVFPNPTTEKITVLGSFQKLTNIAVYNAIGNEVTSKVGMEQLDLTKIELDLSHLPSGAYFVKCKTDVLKVIKL